MLTMRNAVDRLFDEALSSPLSIYGEWSAPLVDMYQTDENVVVKAAIPGVKPEDISINVRENVLNISAKIEQVSEVEGATYHLRERRYGSFSRAIQLPTAVNSEKAEAEYEDGILTLTLPKTEEVLPKSIKIKTKK
jgi:HSP20 family protein